MSQENQITLRGYLTAEPKLYQKTPMATPLTEFRVGSTPRRMNRETGEWQDLPTSYYKVKCWRRLAINTASSLHKGDMVIVRGHFYVDTWVDSQQRPRTSIEVEADTVGHDLAYGWSHYLRGTRPSGNSAAANSGEEARQDTEASASGDRDDESSPGLDANGSQGTGEAAPPPDLPADADADADTEAEAWHPGFSAVVTADARDAADVADTADRQLADAAGDAPGTSDATSDADSRELVAAPF